jgi:hypothetical protein
VVKRRACAVPLQPQLAIAIGRQLHLLLVVLVLVVVPVLNKNLVRRHISAYARVRGYS